MSAMDPIDEHRRWAESADAWGRWAEPMAEPADRINRPLLDMAGVGPGERVLDIASGAGEPGLSIADRIGPAGLAIGTDFVPAMLVHADRRARSRGVPLRLAAADMRRLPFGDAMFDRVVCRFGLMFIPDPVEALAEMARVLRPGGRLAVAVWGPLAENTLFHVILSTLDAQLGTDPLEPLAPLFRFSSQGALSSTMAKAGLTQPEERDLRLDQRVPVDRPFWRATLEMGFTPRLAALSPEQRAGAEDAVARRFATLAGPDGLAPIALHVRLGGAVRC